LLSGSAGITNLPAKILAVSQRLTLMGFKNSLLALAPLCAYYVVGQDAARIASPKLCVG